VSSTLAFAPSTNVASTSTSLAMSRLNDANTMDDRRSFVTKVGVVKIAPADVWLN
jgi:hypothetical protein